MTKLDQRVQQAVGRSRHVLYLHGLGSSPQSAKATLIAKHLRKQGFSVHLPDLNLPSFERLSPHTIVEAVVDLIEASIVTKADSAGVGIIGSSFGGFIALHALNALRPVIRKQVGRLVLLAPAVDPWHARSTLLSPEIEAQWKVAGMLPLFHHAFGYATPVHYAFVEELKTLNRVKPVPDIQTLFIHGTRDDVVSYEQSVLLSERCADSQIVLTDDGHDLLGDPEQLVLRVGDFLQN